VLKHVNVGGGLGVRYHNETPPAMSDYARVVLDAFPGGKYKLLFEPGRLLTADAGLLLTRIEYLKRGEERNFAIVDAAMNDLIRPALYDAWHDVLPIVQHDEVDVYDVVGPVCETGDFLARNRRIAARQGELLAIMSAGAYGMSMASNYNTRPRAAEVMVDRDEIYVIGEREQVHDLFAREHCLPAAERVKHTQE